MRAAFAVALGCLAGAAWIAYDLQTVTPNKNLPGMSQLLAQDQQIDKLKKGMGNSVTGLRDFLLDPKEQATKRFTTLLVKQRVEANSLLEDLESKSSGAEVITQLRPFLEDFYNALELISDMRAAERRERGIDVQKDFLGHQRLNLNRQLTDAAEQCTAQQTVIRNKYGASRMAAIRSLLALIGVVFVMAVLALFLHLRYTGNLQYESAMKLDALSGAKSEMEQLSARLFKIQEEERRRLSRELHDGIGQTLTALRIEISHFHVPGEVAPVETRERWLRARSLAEDAVRTIRNISLLLRPSLLDDLGLEPALRWLAEEFSRRTGIACEYYSEGLDDQFADAWKTCVYRVVQEALHNCEKHASPFKVRISLKQQDGMLELSVEDDGVGFEQGANGSPLRQAGLGILGMRERAAMLGGKISLVSSPGHGTHVMMSLPLVKLAPQRKQISTAERQLAAAQARND